jgi:DNA-binding NarL/FixJ family response regulator
MASLVRPLNGAEGASAVERLRPNIVIFDLSMPVMDGIEATILIKKLRPETRLLMSTSYPTPSIEEAARAVGIEAFVPKNNGDMALLEGLHRLAALPSAFTKGA